ncbi:hypothetical protein CPB84DRAFT_1746961 [Gymnopilus junonius]|uniref:Uncharacterized protein n=1 Tax=Gymnopilus junonius TaxID=109634 RepID=A0A9P5TPD9_GYMJU|nr:hypothetical protein CPB84DRAFT_1746961 [Gymnopilus junonius]
MAFSFWSWIFIFQTLLIRSACALPVSHDYEVLARRALETVFIRDFTDEQKAKNTYVALAIAAGVVFLAVIVGLALLYLRHRVVASELESGVTDASTKPHWWMVESKNEKMDWWRLSHRLSGIESPQSDSGRSRIERLREALNIQRKNKNQAPTLPIHHPVDQKLPVPTNDIQPRYPDSLERGFQAPIYPVQDPQIPKLVVTLSTPPRAIVTQGQRVTLSRSLARNGVPRSPASRRWLHRKSFRNPFLPLRDTDAALPTISAPVAVTIDSSNLKLNYAFSIKEPRPAPLPPTGRNLAVPVPSKVGMRKPAPLRLEQPFGLPQGRLGLPASPRPLVSPAF